MLHGSNWSNCDGLVILQPHNLAIGALTHSRCLHESIRRCSDYPAEKSLKLVYFNERIYMLLFGSVFFIIYIYNYIYMQDQAKLVWGEGDFPCISLATGASAMHKLR
jgi:hypothetical protein